MSEQPKGIDLRNVAYGDLFGHLIPRGNPSEDDLTVVLVDMGDYRAMVRAATHMRLFSAKARQREPIEINGIAYTPASWGDCTEGLDDA